MRTPPAVVAVTMGYGHLRAAAPLAEVLGVPLLRADLPPLANGAEQQRWARTRRTYEATTRLSQLRFFGSPLKLVVDAVTAIAPLHPARDLSAPTLGARALDRMLESGLGAGLIEHLRKSQAPLVTTFYSAAIAAARAGLHDVYCVVTDADVNRVWAPLEAAHTSIRYLAPSARAVRRLGAYGVPEANIALTGFPLPPKLLGGPALPALRANLARRLTRLDIRGAFTARARGAVEALLGPLSTEEKSPPRIVFAVGGAGAHADVAGPLLKSLRESLERDRLRLTLVAGIRTEVAQHFHAAIHAAGLEAQLGHTLEVLHENDFDTYYHRFNARLADADILWTKPSEMTFYAALGLPLILAPAVGVHERYNGRWAIENSAGLVQRDPRHAAEWITEWLDDGTLAAAAWSGFLRLPQRGTYEIARIVTNA